jgi:small subunit ribosomal protein S6
MKYELIVILKPLLPEDIRSSVLNKLEKVIKDNKGKVGSQDVWGKRHLAYPINKHEEGYYIVYQLELAPKSVKELQREFNLMNDIIRFLLIKAGK